MNDEHENLCNSVFEESWWLDIVTNNNWKLYYVKDENGDIIARFP